MRFDIRPLRPELGQALESCPLDADLTLSDSSTGSASTFKRARFKIVNWHVPPRPIMGSILKNDDRSPR